MAARTATVCIAAGAALAGLAAYSVNAAPRPVEAFDSAGWAALQATLKQPAVVVFSTTDCAHCPAVFGQLAQAIRQRQRKAQLIAVVMDVAPGDDDDALQRQPHYQRADRLFAFAGQANAIRFAVEPRWRGVTPYVVFLRPGQTARAVTGPPSAADIDTWLQPRAGSATPR
jgi:hypothetical protein